MKQALRRLVGWKTQLFNQSGALEIVALMAARPGATNPIAEARVRGRLTPPGCYRHPGPIG
jgi:hypothetical protein